jgi:hypothetical protein
MELQPALELLRIPATREVAEVLVRFAELDFTQGESLMVAVNPVGLRSDPVLERQ